MLTLKTAHSNCSSSDRNSAQYMRIRRFLVSLSVACSTLISTSAVGALPGAGFVYPLMGTRISSDFGDRTHPVLRVIKHHNGIDLAAPQSAPIRAIRPGLVVFADPYGGYGNLVVVDHGNGLTSHYGHCEKIIARPGQRVKAGQIIALVGATGRVTGPHLHFEIRKNGEPQDPESLLPGIAATSEG
jgi:murein DD-endopeptidase MepM/ murein hydrolase activator NlpD